VEVESTLDDVRLVRGRTGTDRYVVRDASGREYTTFRDAIGRRAMGLRGRRVRIAFHEEERGRYRNVYVDEVEPLDSGAAAEGSARGAEEAAWRTAVDAAPWLVGEPGETVSPEQLYEKLKPFESRVARDIEAGEERDAEGGL